LQCSRSPIVDRQKEYDTFIIIADVQALTTHFERPELINSSIYDVAIDNLSVGLDPDDTSKDEIIQQYDKDTVLDEVAEWNGLINYGSIIKSWIEDIYGIKLS
jgi:tryptophanyl-tRNA synthetase